MKTGRKGSLLARVERLEQWTAVSRIRLRFGNLRRLPKGYQGPHHIVIVKHVPNQSGNEWVEYEEVPGPEPPPAVAPKATDQYINIVFVPPYPEDAP